MGKKGGWFSAVKKAFNLDSKEKEQLKNSKSKKWPAKEKESDCPPPSGEEPGAPCEHQLPPPSPPNVEETKTDEVIENNVDSNNDRSDMLPTAEDEEAVIHATPKEDLLKNMSCYSGKSMEEIAAIRIQTVFRSFMAKRELRDLRGLERLRSLIEGQSVKRQSATTLKCMQNLAHLQTQIRARRIRMSEENQALHRQLQQKHETDLERLRIGKDWDVSMQSKEQIEANLQSKQEAAMRRERALAYSFSHQTKKNSRSVNPSFMDPNNPHWGWSWLERWMASRPWETRSATVMDNDNASSKSMVSRSVSLNGDTKQKTTLTKIGQKAARPLNRQSLPTKIGSLKNPIDDDSKSTTSVQTLPPRRHSVGGTSVRDDESHASSSPVPSYMTSTKSTKARSKMASPLGVVANAAASEKGSIKKRLSFPAGPPAGTRRHSVPGRIESSTEKSGVNSQA